MINIKMNKTNNKIIRVLRKIDDIMTKYGYNHYQERIHRIYKTLLSIERDAECFVSNFSIDGDQSTTTQENQDINQIYSSNYVTASYDKDNNEIIKLDEGNNKMEKVELEDVLNFIEDELKMKENDKEGSTTVFSSESSEEVLDSNSKEDLSEEKTENKKKLNNKNKNNLQKKISKIELLLRDYIKEEVNKNEHFNRNNFDSFLNDSSLSKTKTPLSKMTPFKNISPIKIKNFFEDKSVIEYAKKRYSVNELKLPILSNFKKEKKDKLKCYSTMDKVAINNNNNTTENQSQNISNFSVDFSNSSNNEISTSNIDHGNNNLNFKRGSIFKDRYMFNEQEFNNIEEEINENKEKDEEDENHSLENSFDNEYN
jgi:hypothetical protein